MATTFTAPPDAVGAVPPAMAFDLNFRIELTGESYEIAGVGTVHVAVITDAPAHVKRDTFIALLVGQRVAGRGEIARIDSFATMHIGTGPSWSIGVVFRASSVLPSSQGRSPSYR